MREVLHGDSKVFLPLLLSLVIVAIIFLFSYTYLYAQEPEINLEAWTGDIVYAEDANLSTPQSCDGRMVLVGYYASALIDGKPLEDGNVTVFVYFSNDTAFSINEIGLEFNETTNIWSRKVVHNCMPFGSYYGMMSASFEMDNKTFDISNSTSNFDIVVYNG